MSCATEQSLSSDVLSDISKIQEQKPLVFNITNYVVMNWNANCLLSIGASPIMAHASEEIEELVCISHSLVLNIGTLSQPWVESMVQAAGIASQMQKPIVIDPVGVGASSFRKESVQRILKAASPMPARTVIRGNASEILSLAHGTTSGKGVDSSDSSGAAIDAAMGLSKQWGCPVCVSGPVDSIVFQDEVVSNSSGHSLMTQVTGMGCAATAVIGAFLAVQKSPARAALNAMSLMGLAGEKAAARARGPGSFQTHFLDELFAVALEARVQSVNHEASL